MTSKYQDIHTMWHHKPCVNGEPSSNNAWIYSAYSKYMSPKSIDMQTVYRRYLDCVEALDPIIINRKPGIKYPVISKDEIIGMASLGLLTDSELENSHYNFCNLDALFKRKLTFSSFVKAAKSLWKIRKEHRNYFWQNEMVETYPLAFWLDFGDQYYVKKLYGKKAGIIRTVFFYTNAITTYFGKSSSTKMLTWLKLKDLGMDRLAKLFLNKQVLADLYPEDHDFRKNLLDN